MNTFSQFLAMGGYAGFVWPAYGVTAAVLVLLLIDTLRRVRRRRAELVRLEAPGRGRPSGTAEAGTDDA
ncbi:MAG: heme exporter protein CcmD [Proteobacteria bacterium]|nr:heme exporter protein CcmD [Pseudomonadota bacterium]MBI3499569.1 heme exporter protein CcmD [Pseudomonadota bacterium]